MSVEMLPESVRARIRGARGRGRVGDVGGVDRVDDAGAVGRRVRPGLRLALLGALAAAACLFFALYGAWDAWALIGPIRLGRLASLVVVAVAVAVSTVLFQTVTDNRILTPSVMGFDALFAFIQTAGIVVLGAGTMAAMPAATKFGVELGIMLVASTALFTWILGGAKRSLYLLVLVGIVLGTFIRSISAFLQRIISPDAFLVLQDALFASFANVKPELLSIASAIVAACCLFVAVTHRRLDVLALGRATAVTLGVDHRRWVMVVLAICSLLVSVSTALVGPVTFFGLLVAHIGYQVVVTHRHAFTVPAAALVSVITLVGGQAVLEHLFKLSVVIEFLGGIVFLVLIVRGGRR